jgi:RNA polymerase sigma-70 factor (ECF subfamily)
MPPPSDVEGLQRLLELARQGEAEALGRLLENYRPYLLRIATQEVPQGLQAKLGDSDVVQETILEALRCFAAFRGEAPAELQGWLRTILLRQVSQASQRFVATDKRRLDREVPLPQLGDSAEVLAADQSTPSAAAGREEQTARVQAVLSRLPEQYRQVLVWREWDDLPFAEIARRLDKSVDAARMLWWRAFERFQQELGGEP